MKEAVVMRRRSRKAGVTLIEMLVVVTIIAVFAVVVAPKMLGHADDARRKAAKVQITNFETALGSYKLDTSTFPSNEQGFTALRARPEGLTQWQGPYLTQEIPNDPWGHPYIYKYPGDHGDEPDIISLGADGQPGG